MYLHVYPLDSPFLKLNEMIFCNNSEPLVISCKALGQLPVFGFFEWVHSFNGKTIRELNGTSVGNVYRLVLNSCGYKDAGSYTCRAWNDFSGNIYISNITTQVEVEGNAYMPYLISTKLNIYY